MKIIAVDDEYIQLKSLEEAIREAVADCEIACFENPIEALKYAKNNTPDVVFSDIQMPLMNGIMLGKELKKINPQVNLVFVTSYYQDYAVAAFELRSSGYLQKPVSADKVAMEIDNLRYPVVYAPSKTKLRVQCFGRFEVFVDEKPMVFERSRTKEVFAFLIDKKGKAVNGNEICAALYPENGPKEANNKSDLRKCVADLRSRLREIGAEDVFLKGFNSYAIVPSMVDCDYYNWESGDPDAIRAFHGKYMSQYDWADETLETILMPDFFFE